MTDLERLLAIHDITQLKYCYMRALDTHQWDLLATCFTQDARAWYSGGRYSTEGRDRIVGMLSDLIIDDFHGSHIALHPEIDVQSSDTASGIWRFQDLVHFTATYGTHTAGEQLVGAGIYYDEYRRTEAGWQIASTGYERLFESVERRTPGSEEYSFELRPGPNRGIRQST